MGREHSTDGGRRVGREHTSMRVEREPRIDESSEEVWLLTPGEGRPAIAFAKAVAGRPTSARATCADQAQLRARSGGVQGESAHLPQLQLLGRHAELRADRPQLRRKGGNDLGQSQLDLLLPQQRVGAVEALAVRLPQD